MTHANLLIGGDASALELAAKELARLAVCPNSANGKACGVCRDCRKASQGIHPDIITVRKSEDKKEFTIDLVRGMITEAQFLPTEAERKVFILPDASAMNLNASNAFLKLLEEPPARVVFILLGERLGDFLQTIQSRCNVVRVGGSETAERLHGSADAIFAAYTLRNAQSVAAECMKLEKLKREELQAVLEALYMKFAEAAVHDARLLEPLERVAEPAQRLRSGLNLGSGHVAGTLMVDLTQMLI